MPILIRRLSRLLLALLITCGSAGLHAQTSAPGDTPAAAVTPEQSLDQLSSQLDTVRAALKDSKSDASLADLRNATLAVQNQARQLAGALLPQMSALQAQLAVLGPVPAKGKPAEAPEVSAQRHQLDKASANLDAQIKQAQLVNQNAVQLAAQITGLRNDAFQARLASRTATPFSGAFWIDPARALPDDMVRVKRLGALFVHDWRQAWQPPNRQPLLFCLIAAALLLGVGRWLLERLLLGLTTTHLPDGHLRRSAMATAVALSAVLTTGLAASLVYLGLNWNDILDPDLDALAASLVRLVFFAAFVTGLGRALLSVKRPTWRLPPLSDLAAQRLSIFPWLLGAAALLLGAFERISRTIGSSLAVSVATRGLIALVVSGLLGAALLRLRATRQAMAAAGTKPAQRPVWVGLLGAGAVMGVIVSWLGVASGFIALAYFAALQMLWIGMIVGALYLLSHLLQDLFETLLSPQGRSGQRLQAVFELEVSTLQQAAIVLSGLSRILLLLLALATVLAPFGAAPADLLASATHIFGGLKLGDLPIQPGTILTGVLVFVVGLAALRALKRWLGEQLLPATSMERGMQDSIVTLLGYLGGLLVFVLALAALHVNLTSIAWIVSALSVGIGFGLQAIVQNFISGLILLAERPVKVGDWISLSGVEGDIRRINVRATEIQLWDRSTMIVPNSQLITQNVRNVTLGNALGRVSFKLPMPLDTDADRARGIILEALHGLASTLATPPPYVQLDSIDTNCMVFSAYAYTSSPREANAAKSDLLFRILQRLREEKLPLIRPQDMLFRTLPPASAESSDSHP
jgi:potassium efflux system protein